MRADGPAPEVPHRKEHAMKPRVLILCTGNSCRSQMAEGFLRHAAGDLLDVHSAGTHPTGHVHPLAVEVMREVGIDISGHTSKSLEPFLETGVDVVVSVCASAGCAVFPGGAKRLHWEFDDPPTSRLPGEEAIDSFRRVRDGIRRTFTAYAEGYRDAAGQPFSTT
jgi:arsenate reductase (thioredoxin)